MQTPLAWYNLTHDRKRLLTAVGGIGFAVLLMFMQLGFRGALFDATVLVPRRFDADLVVIRPNRYTLSVYSRFPLRYLKLAAADPAVAATAPMYFENQRSTWKPDGQPVGPPIRVLAFNPADSVLTISEVAEQAAKLNEPMTALLDSRSKGDFRGVPVGASLEINGRRVKIVGQYALGTDFADDGTIIVSDTTFDALFYGHLPPGESLSAVDFGLVRLVPSADVAEARKALDAVLPEDVVVMTRPEYVDFELDFWRTATPIGYVFALGTVMGFIVGMTICYQILFADITDHLREFATLKAMGYQAPFFIGVVLQEATLLAPLGFVPGLLAAWGLYEAVETLTGLPMDLSGGRVLAVLGLTVVMCLASGVLTIRRVLTAEPAELFA
jgi:putative ABC transport system permease protein